jgi:predicted glycoside hydrolase/deacetylase ChbG (UPF0249 family)
MKVVFHADDFGLSTAVNDGILEAHERGVLGSTSLIVAGQAAAHAADLARRKPSLDVGIHLTLVEEAPVLPPERIPSLVSGGRFWPKHTSVAARWARGAWRTDEATAELAAQWERFQALGLVPSHADGHQHLHLLPGVLPRVVAEARRRGVRFVRTTLVGPLRIGAGLVRQGLLIATDVVARWAVGGVAAADRAGLVPFVTMGFLDAGGTLTRDTLLDGLDRLRRRRSDAIVEVMLHPGHRDAETAARYGHWHYAWERDFGLLVDPHLRDELARRDVTVTSFAALARERARG